MLVKSIRCINEPSSFLMHSRSCGAVNRSMQMSTGLFPNPIKSTDAGYPPRPLSRVRDPRPGDVDGLAGGKGPLRLHCQEPARTKMTIVPSVKRLASSTSVAPSSLAASSSSKRRSSVVIRKRPQRG